MARFLKKAEAAHANIPGEPVFIGKRKMDKINIHVIDFNDKLLEEIKPDKVEDLSKLRDTTTTSWININGLHDTEAIKALAKNFNLHPLVAEDIANTGQRPKMEDYDDHLFFTLKMMRYDHENKKVESEQLSLVVGSNFLITFQERPGDVFEPVRKRIRNKLGRIRHHGVDYLAYALLDSVVDNYMLIIERIGEQIEEIEDEILSNLNKGVLNKINDYKREMNYLRKTIRPVKEFMLQLSRLDTNLFREDTQPFIKDLLDISTQAVESIDTYRLMLSDHLDIYNSSINNRLNEIMKVLTIFSAIFIPLTFIAGIYGTNFEFIPELGFKYSYPIFWGVLILVASVMLRFFRKKKWL
jgi:magnesium transporter